MTFLYDEGNGVNENSSEIIEIAYLRFFDDDFSTVMCYSGLHRPECTRCEAYDMYYDGFEMDIENGMELRKMPVQLFIKMFTPKIAAWGIEDDPVDDDDEEIMLKFPKPNTGKHLLPGQTF